MKPFFVVNDFDKILDVRLGVEDGVVLVDIDLFRFESFHE